MINVKHALHECLAMFIFVAINCFVANSEVLLAPAVANSWDSSHSDKSLTIALSFGLTITALVYMFAHTSGAQINAAVTFTLMLCTQFTPALFDGMSIPQGIANMIGQFLGAFGGAFYVHFMFDSDKAVGGLGVNAVAPGISNEAAILAESVCTFLLCYVVLMTAVDGKSFARAGEPDDSGLPKPTMAPIAIGFTVFIGHLVCMPLTGCSINPTRSLGPAVVSSMLDRSTGGDVWLCFIPFIGSIAAWLVYASSKANLCNVAAEAASRNVKSQKTVDRKRSNTKRSR